MLALSETSKQRLERVGLGKQARPEMIHLRQRSEELELIVANLSLEVSHEHNNKGRGNRNRRHRNATE